MKQTYDVLIVEDHPAVYPAYEFAFNQIANDKGINFKLNFARDCDSALYKIEYAKSSNNFDLVFLDISIPASKDGKFINGSDIGTEIRNTFPETKIIIFTGFSDNYFITNTLKELNPEGFLVKTDVSTKELITAIDVSLLNPPFYSQTVMKLLRKHMANDFTLSNRDRKIIHLLSQGVKMSNLDEHINLSTSGIEARKRNLKKVFKIEGESDHVLIRLAREKGFI